MRQVYIFSGILLILPIIDFAVAAPVLVQEKRQAGVNVVQIREDAVPMLWKRADELEKMFLMDEGYIDRLKESLNARPSSSSRPSGPNQGWTDVEKPLPSIPEKPSPISSPGSDLEPPSPESLTKSGYDLMEGDGPSRTSSLGSWTMSDADHELVGEHALPNTGSSTESSHGSTEVHAPLSSPVFPTWFHPDPGLMDPVHAPQPNLGPSNLRPSTELDPDHKLVVGEPPSTESDVDREYRMVHPTLSSSDSASLADSDHEMAGVSPSSPALSTNPNRRSMGADTRLKNFQVVSGALKRNAKESRHISGTARDLLNAGYAAQRELQRERSLNLVE
jgi:hypothetical protein